MSNEVKTAESYRQLAEALRGAADRMNEPEQAGAARAMAANYDQVAKDLDNAEPSALKKT